MTWLKQLLIIALAACLLAVPVSAQGDAKYDNPKGSTPTTLYLHIFDTFNKFVINTQPMNADSFDVGGTNFPTLVGTPVNTVAGADYDFNTIYGTSTAGPVEYGFIENGRPRFHPEKGIAADVKFDMNYDAGGGKPAMLYLYIEARDVLGCGGSADCNAIAPNCLPELTVRLTMREGDDPGPDVNLDAGAEIMKGEMTKTICTNAEAASLVGGAAPDAAGVIEYAIPLDILSPIIPKSEAFNVRIDWYQALAPGVCGVDQCAEGYMRLKADQEHLPRIEFAITNPIYIEFIHPQVAAGTLLIHTGVNSPWGTYDIAEKNIELTIVGPNGPVESNQIQRVVATNEVVHGLHDKAAEITYLWNYRDLGAKDGDYTVTMKVPNETGTATATGVEPIKLVGKKVFVIDDQGKEVEATSTVKETTKGSPNVGVVGILGLLGAALVVLRRRN